MTTIVLLAHGSPDPRSQRAVHDAADIVARRSASTVTAAFLDHDERDLRAAVAEFDDTERIAVLPLLLSTAFHARVDVPAAVAALDRTVDLLDPIGHPPQVLDALLLRCAGPTVLVAAGTRIDEERHAFAHAVARAAARTHVPAVAAYATGPGRRLTDATRPDGAVVVPWLLAPGRILDTVHDSARRHGYDTLGGGLLGEPALLQVVVERVSSTGSRRA
jgi:sirohydrochlorin ferrochelatase